MGFVCFADAVAPTPGPEVPLQAQPTPPPPESLPELTSVFAELPPSPAIDVADFTVARLREESRNGALSIADLQELLAQEETKKRPRGTAVAIMKRSIRQRQVTPEV